GLPSPPAIARPLVAMDALAFYFRQILFPWRLASDYGRTPEWLLSHRGQWLCALVPLILAVVIVRLRRPAVTAGACLLIAGVLPVLWLSTFQYQVFSTVADHYLYTAMIGPALLTAWAAQRRTPAVVLS